MAMSGSQLFVAGSSYCIPAWTISKWLEIDFFILPGSYWFYQQGLKKGGRLQREEEEKKIDEKMECVRVGIEKGRKER